MDFSSARQCFYHEIHQQDEQIDLARAALYIAQEEYADLDPEEYLNALDTMAADLQERLPAEPYPLRIVQTINAYLYDDLQFRGNRDHYYDPENSYLNRVIDHRTGIPITLSLVYLELAKRIDFPMVGVGMPGHFLIRPDRSDLEIFVDPFNQGEVMFVQDCEERLKQLYGDVIEFRDEFLDPVSPRRFLARMLTNLKGIYLSQGEMAKVLATIDRILLLFPDAALEQRDRGLIYYQVGRWIEARQDLESYLGQRPAARDAIAIRELLNRIVTRTP